MPYKPGASIEAVLEADPEDVPRLVAKACAIDLGDLESTLQKHPGLYAYVVARFEMARIDEYRAKRLLEIEQAGAFKALVEELSAVSRAEKLVDLDEDVIKQKEVVTEAYALTARLKALLAGFDHRRDMLLQISSRQRAEMGL